MANHYMQVAVGTELVDIPCPAVDITTSNQRFGYTGQFISGGAFSRLSRFGARRIEVSWNNLNTEDINLLHMFEEKVLANNNKFLFIDPFAHLNIMPPWLSNHSMKVLPNGAYLENYMLGENLQSTTTLPAVGNYPERVFEITTSNERELDFYIPEGYVGILLGLASTGEPGSYGYRPKGATTPFIPIPAHTAPASGNTVELQPGIYTLGITEPRARLGGIFLRLVPEGDLLPAHTYAPGRGLTEISFTDEPLSIVQHNVPLDLQSASTVWIETGWWDN